MPSNTPQADEWEPREHHYVFAHYAVREICLEDPLRFFHLIASPERDEFLAWLWTTVEERVERPIADIDLHQLSVITTRLKNRPAILIQMPAAVATTEAHFIGMVLGESPGGAPVEAAVSLRYFTLEQGDSFDGASTTMLCEWAQGTHRNYGEGPPPVVDAFAKAIEARL
jgi:hypothetical protein